MNKQAALILRQVGKKWQALLPGGILVKEFKHKWEALGFSMTDDEKQAILNKIKTAKDNKKAVGIQESPEVKLATVSVEIPLAVSEPEGIKAKSPAQMKPTLKLNKGNKHV